MSHDGGQLKLVIGRVGRTIGFLAALATIVSLFLYVWMPETKNSVQSAWGAIDAIDQYEPDFKKAMAAAKEAAHKRPNNGVILLAQAVIAWRMEPLDADGSAARLLTRAERRLRRSSRPSYYLGVISAYNGEYCKAIKHFLRAIGRDPGDPDPVSGLGSAISVAVYKRLSCTGGGLEFALRCLSRATELAAIKDPMLHYRHADALLLHGHVDDAIIEFWKGFYADHESERAGRYEARLYAAAPDDNTALRILDDLASAPKATVWVSYDRAVLRWCSSRDLYGARKLVRGVQSEISQIKRLKAALYGGASREGTCEEIQRESPLLWRDL